MAEATTTSSHCSDLPRNHSYHSNLHVQKMRRLQRQIETISSMKRSYMKANPQTQNRPSLPVSLNSEDQFARPYPWSPQMAFEARRKREQTFGKVRSHKWPLHVRHVHMPNKVQETRGQFVYPKVVEVEQSGSSIAMKNLIADIIDDVIGSEDHQRGGPNQFRSRISGRVYPQPIARLYEVPIQSEPVPLNLSLRHRKTNSSISSPSTSSEANFVKPTTSEETKNQSRMNEFCLRKLKLHQSTSISQLK